MTYTTRDVALERNGTLRTVKFKVWVSRCQVAAGFQLLAPFIYSNPFFGIFWVWLGRTSVISNISLFEDENPDFQPTFCCCSLGAQDVPASHIDYQPWNRITRNERKICTTSNLLTLLRATSSPQFHKSNTIGSFSQRYHVRHAIH